MSFDQNISLEKSIPEELTGLRLDQTLAKLFPRYSRALLQTWIQEGCVSLDNKVCTKNNLKVKPHQAVIIKATLKAAVSWQAEAINLDIVYEDDALIVVNKPAGLVTHPGAGNPKSTLVNALLHHIPDLTHLPRAGIIHRLDKDTTGLLLSAKTDLAYTQLSLAMKNRKIQREYLALIKGNPLSGKTIDAPIGRHPTQRTKMAVTPQGKPAITHFRIEERFKTCTLVRVQLDTGRTHQIRVHLFHIHHPILGDQTYGKHIQTPQFSGDTLKTALKQLTRQALHAQRLTFTHPTTQETVSFEAPLPRDFEDILHALRTDHE